VTDSVNVREAEPAPSSVEDLRPCLSCGERAMASFCAECGERRRTESDYSLRRFAAHALQTVSNVDSTVGRSFASLFAWPGHLTAEHYRGRRKPYLDPVQLFLVCNLVYFALDSLGVGGVFTTTLVDQLRHHPYSSWLHGVATGTGTTFGELLRDPVALEGYGETYDAMTRILAKSLVFMMVPIWAALSWLAYGRSARYYAQHLIFALHVWAYLLLLICLVGFAMFAVKVAIAQFGVRFSWEVWDAILLLLMSSMLGVYLAEAGRRAFRETLGWTVIKAIALTFALLPVIWVYRLILFFATVAAV
jgi:hypothetical protein